MQQQNLVRSVNCRINDKSMVLGLEIVEFQFVNLNFKFEILFWNSASSMSSSRFITNNVKCHKITIYIYKTVNDIQYKQSSE